MSSGEVGGGRGAGRVFAGNLGGGGLICFRGQNSLQGPKQAIYALRYASQRIIFATQCIFIRLVVFASEIHCDVGHDAGIIASAMPQCGERKGVFRREGAFFVRRGLANVILAQSEKYNPPPNFLADTASPSPGRPPPGILNKTHPPPPYEAP